MNREQKSFQANRPKNAPGLYEQGFRFVQRGAEFKWMHAAEVVASDLDCIEMTDAQFEQAVAAAHDGRVCTAISRNEQIAKDMGVRLPTAQQVAGMDSTWSSLS